MKVHSRRSSQGPKDQQPFFGPAHKQADQKTSPFFGKSSIQRKGDPSQKAGEEEKKQDLQNQNKDLEKEKDAVQKKGKDEAPEEKKDPKARETKKKDEEPVQKKAIRRKGKEQAGRIRRQGDGGAREASPELEQKLLASKGRGFALPEDLRQELGEKLGYDFGPVVIHTDAEAVEMAEELEALAFTHGNHIYFNRGQYAPRTATGRQLLLHELVHVRQQES